MLTVFTFPISLTKMLTYTLHRNGHRAETNHQIALVNDYAQIVRQIVLN